MSSSISSVLTQGALLVLASVSIVAIEIAADNDEVCRVLDEIVDDVFNRL